MQVRHPEAVDDVARHDVQHDGDADRDVQFVRTGDDVPWRDVAVLKIPPPLMADHVNGQRARPAGRSQSAVGRER